MNSEVQDTASCRWEPRMLVVQPPLQLVRVCVQGCRVACESSGSCTQVPSASVEQADSHSVVQAPLA